MSLNVEVYVTDDLRRRAAGAYLRMLAIEIEEGSIVGFNMCWTKKQKIEVTLQGAISPPSGQEE